MSKFVNNVIEKLEDKQDKTWSHDDVAMLMRDAMAKMSVKTNNETQDLIDQLELLNAALDPIQKILENCKEDANLTANRYGWTFASIILLQFLATQYGTYIAFSWDVLEPITAMITLSDAVIGYFFWLWAGRPWNVDSIRMFFFSRRVDTLLRRNRIDKEHYMALYRARNEVLKKLYNH